MFIAINQFAYIYWVWTRTSQFYEAFLKNSKKTQDYIFEFIKFLFDIVRKKRTQKFM